MPVPELFSVRLPVPDERFHPEARGDVNVTRLTLIFPERIGWLPGVPGITATSLEPGRPPVQLPAALKLVPLLFQVTFAAKTQSPARQDSAQRRNRRRSGEGDSLMSARDAAKCMQYVPIVNVVFTLFGDIPRATVGFFIKRPMGSLMRYTKSGASSLEGPSPSGP